MAAHETLPEGQVADFSDAQKDYESAIKRWRQSETRTDKPIDRVAEWPGHSENPVKIIAVYNFKGGVGKTTNTMNLGAALSKAGKRTVMVDADPQCNLTNFFQPPAKQEAAPDSDEDYQAAADATAAAAAGLPPMDEYPLPRSAVSAIEMDYMKVTDIRMYNSGIQDLYSLLRPPFDGEGLGSLLPPDKLFSVANKCTSNLWLVPGSPLLPKLETKLSMAAVDDSTASIYLGSFGKLFKGIAAVTKADYILVDMSPSMSLLNKTILQSCNYILPPLFTDFFSLSSMHTLLAEMIPMMMDDHEKLLKRQPDCLTASQKALGYAANPKFPRILPFLVTKFSKKTKDGNDFIVKHDADWLMSMKMICDPALKFLDARVYELFIPNAGNNMVVPLMYKYDMLNGLSHSYGCPAALMDKDYFVREVVPGEIAACTPPAKPPSLIFYKATGYEMSALVLQKYTTVVNFLDAISPLHRPQIGPDGGPPISELNKSVVALGAGFDTPKGILHPKGQKGTGFFITKEGYLSTCHHVLHDIERDNRLAPPTGASRVYCVGIGSPIQWTYRASVVYQSSRPGLEPQHSEDPMLDLAVLRIDQRLDKSAIRDVFKPLTLGDSTTAKDGSRLWILGYGQQNCDVTDTTNTVDGCLSGRHTDKDGNWLRTNADMLGGHSGGPAVLGNGHVVGWCVKSHADSLGGGKAVAVGGLHALRPIEDAAKFYKELTAGVKDIHLGGPAKRAKSSHTRR